MWLQLLLFLTMFKYCCDVVTGVDPCLTNACENGGTCTRRGRSYSCACPVGYTGRNCETSKQERHLNISHTLFLRDTRHMVGLS